MEIMEFSIEMDTYDEETYLRYIFLYDTYENLFSTNYRFILYYILFYIYIMFLAGILGPMHDWIMLEIVEEPDDEMSVHL